MRTGIGGIIGQQRKYFSWRFAVDFTGGELVAISKQTDVEPVVSASRGEIQFASLRDGKPKSMVIGQCSI
jgi:glucans biosynthesis protein